MDVPGSNIPFVSLPETLMNGALVNAARIEADTISREPPCCFCKEQKQKCLKACNYYPYFPAEQFKEYTVVSTIFNIKNFIGLVGLVHPQDRMKARNNIVIAAIYRALNPSYDPTTEITKLRAIMTDLEEMQCKRDD